VAPPLSAGRITISVLFLSEESVLCCDGDKLGLAKCLIKVLSLCLMNLPAEEFAVVLHISFIEFSVLCESWDIGGVKVLGRRKGSRLAYSGGSEVFL